MLVAGLLVSTALADAHQGSIAGVDWVPFGRADLVWVDAGRGTGTLSGEGDGWLTPPMSAWAGWASPRNAFTGGLGVAWEAAAAWTATEEGDVVTHIRHGAVRLAADYRRYLREREARTPLPWLQAGIYGVVPFASYSSDAWTKAEQKAYDETAKEDRARLAAYGMRVGAGAEYMWPTGLSVGARQLLVVHRGQEVDENVVTTATFIHGETALVLGLAF